jgi:uncharacterized protein HemY
MDFENLGRLLVVFGVGLVVLGLLFVVIGRTPALDWVGRLPGDVRIQRENFACFAPITSMIILSIILTIVLNLVVRLINR